jgi:ribosome-associated protein
MANKKTAAARSAKRSPSPARRAKRAAPPRKGSAAHRPPPRRPDRARQPPAPGKAARPSRTSRPARPSRPGGPGKAARPAAPPAAAPAPVPAAPPAADEARPTALLIAQAGLDKKAEDVTVIDVRGLTSYADYFVVMTAESERQAGAIADNVEQTLKAKGVPKVGVEGYEGGRWILVDYGDVVAHVMSRESRSFYDLEGLWADAPRISVR